MSTPYEIRLAVRWLSNVVTRIAPRSEEASQLAGWLSENADREVTGKAGKWRPFETLAQAAGLRAKHREPWLRSRWKPSSGDWKRLGDALQELRDRTERAKPDRTARRLQALAKVTGMTREDVEILEVVLRYQTAPFLESLVDELLLADRRHHPFSIHGSVLARLLGLGRSRVQSRLTRSSPLLRSGCLTVDGDGEVSLNHRLERLATVPDKESDVRRLLLGSCLPTDLEWSDFEHLGQAGEDLAALVKGALATSTPGVNILLPGEPGVGKTSLAKVIAAQLGVGLFPVGEADERGDEPTRGERLGDLRLTQSLLSGDGTGLPFVDDADDVLAADGADASLLGLLGASAPRSRGSGSGSRVFLHRLLEENLAPTIWTVNRAEAIPESVLRRMTFVVEMRRPPTRVRGRIWSRQLGQHGIRFTKQDVRNLTREFPDISPGIINGAAKAATFLGRDLGGVRRAATGLTRLVHGPAPRREERQHFDPALSQADVSLKELADDIVSTGLLDFSVCLTGPPGSGKSAWVRYVADRLDLQVLHLRASDLLDSYVGGTEKRIAAAFQRAVDERAFLVIDEADSFLRDRRGASEVWQVSQVNELLTWMESHQYPFACTTNLAEVLDPASLRRFVFKAKLGYLTAEQAERAFRFFFELDPAPELARMRILTPGDFAVVRRQARLRDRLGDADALVRMLQDECDAKPERSGTVGF